MNSKKNLLFYNISHRVHLRLCNFSDFSCIETEMHHIMYNISDRDIWFKIKNNIHDKVFLTFAGGIHDTVYNILKKYENVINKP